MSAWITVLTDFGASDGYVAAMKGVILSLAPEATVVDACHQIGPGDVRAGAWVLNQYWMFYPVGTIHIAVVDPGVGMERRILLLEADRHIFIAPDNGLLSAVMSRAKRVKLHVLKPDIHRPGPVAATFHGRDVFAWAAGQLASGTASVGDLSQPGSDPHPPLWGVAEHSADALSGEIVHVDHFGNLITNITPYDMARVGWTSCAIKAATFEDIPILKTYAEAKPGTLMALYGSSATLEIAVSGGSAAKRTGLRPGDPVAIRRKS